MNRPRIHRARSTAKDLAIEWANLREAALELDMDPEQAEAWADGKLNACQCNLCLRKRAAGFPGCACVSCQGAR